MRVIVFPQFFTNNRRYCTYTIINLELIDSIDVRIDTHLRTTTISFWKEDKEIAVFTVKDLLSDWVVYNLLKNFSDCWNKDIDDRLDEIIERIKMAEVIKNESVANR